jgi:hypothetical protein
VTRRLLLIALAAAALGLAACGNKQATITRGDSEANFVTLGTMQYQVQLSRQLNSSDTGDRALLIGIPPVARTIGPKEIWFGVWVRVTNKSGSPARSADQFKIVDTRGRSYKPVALQSVNAFAYRPSVVQSVYPTLNSVSTNTPPGGAFLLFKLPLDALDFRPLDLAFSSTTLPGRTSTVLLDV